MHARLLVADTSAIGQVRPPHVDQGLQTVVTKDSADPVGPMDGEDVLKNDYCSSVLVTSKARGPVRFVLAPFVAMPFAPNVAFLLLYSLFYFFFFLLLTCTGMSDPCLESAWTGARRTHRPLHRRFLEMWWTVPHSILPQSHESKANREANRNIMKHHKDKGISMFFCTPGSKSRSFPVYIYVCNYVCMYVCNVM